MKISSEEQVAIIFYVDIYQQNTERNLLGTGSI